MSDGTGHECSPLQEKSRRRRTEHARARQTEGRPTGTAFHDAQKARQADVFSSSMQDEQQNEAQLLRQALIKKGDSIVAILAHLFTRAVDNTRRQIIDSVHRVVTGMIQSERKTRG